MMNNPLALEGRGGRGEGEKKKDDKRWNVRKKRTKLNVHAQQQPVQTEDYAAIV